MTKGRIASLFTVRGTHGPNNLILTTVPWLLVKGERQKGNSVCMGLPNFISLKFSMRNRLPWSIRVGNATPTSLPLGDIVYISRIYNF